MKRLSLFVASLALAAAAQGATYPMEGGNLRRSGQAQGITHVALPIDVLWDRYLCAGEPRSNPVVLEDRIIQAFPAGDICISRFDGKEIWRSGAFGDQWNPPVYDATRDLLYQSSMMGAMTALRPSDGTEAWHYFEGVAKNCQNYSSCTYWNDKIYVGASTGRIVCLDADTHAVLWGRTVSAQSGIGTPAMDNGELYVGSFSGQLYRLDAVTGAVVWHITASKTCYSSAISLDDTKMYVMTNLGKVECRSRANGALLWSFQTGSFTLANLSVGPRGVYCTSDDRCMYRLDENDGHVMWQTCFQGNFARSSPFCAGDMVVGSGCVGVFYGIDASNGNGIWDLNHNSWNSFTDFAEADGLLFVCNRDGVMFCLHPQNSPLPPTVTIAPSKTSTPTPTVTVTATETPSSTASPTATSTASPTATVSSTATRSSTATPSGTATPTVTPSASTTRSPTPSASATRTGTPTLSITPSPSASPTRSATSSVTPSSTPSLTSTASPTPTASPTSTTPTAVPTAHSTDGEGKRDPGPGHCYAAPNPVHGGPCHIVYRMRAPGRARVRLFQASGDPVGLVEERHETAGVHSCEVSTQRYAPGVYFCRADLSYDDGDEEHLPLTKFLVLKAR